MKEVNEQEFREFLNGKIYTRKQGDMFHSTDYIDLDGIKIAYIETSSYGASDIFKIKE